MRKIWIPLIALVLALVPAIAAADDGESHDGLLVRVSGDYTLPKGETVDTLIVIDGTAHVDGTITNTLVVIHGDAVITGSVGKDVTVISGDADLQSGATVKNVRSIRGNILQTEGVTITGEIHENEDIDFDFGGALAAFSIVFWIAMTVSLIAAGIVFAAIGGRQLKEACRTMTDAVAAVSGFVFVWIAIPVIGVVAMLTLIGLPFGLGLLLFVLPVLWLLGYIVAGSRLGSFLTGLVGRKNEGAHPFLATALGVLILQLVALIPVVGFLIAAFAGAWGAGALAISAFRAAGGKIGSNPSPAAPISTQPQAA